MSRKLETISDKMEMARRQIVGAAARINEHCDDMAKLEEFLLQRPEVISMFRLQIKSIRMQVEYFGKREED